MGTGTPSTTPGRLDQIACHGSQCLPAGGASYAPQVGRQAAWLSVRLAGWPLGYPFG
jgi:hypothetical protein